MRSLRTETTALVAAAVVLALLAWAVFDTVGADISASLLWGEDFLHGRLPDFEKAGLPTPHPLHVLLGGLATLAGHDAALDVVPIYAYATFGALVVAVYAAAAACFSRTVGALAALATVLNAQLLGPPLAASSDALFLVLVLAALALEARSPRRGAPVLVLLALAGLLRPEGWLIAGVYWMWIAPGLDANGRLRAGALVAVAPVLWIAMDLLVTGDPLHSFERTRDFGRGLHDPGQTGGWPLFALGRPPDEVADSLADGLREGLTPATLVGGAVGAALVLGRRRLPALLPATLLVLGVAAFVVLGVAGLPLLARFLIVPVAMFTICFAAALGAWRDETGRAARRALAALAAALAALWIAVTPAEIADTRDLRDRLRNAGVALDDLYALLDRPAVRAAATACPRTYATLVMPGVAYGLDDLGDRVELARAPLGDGLLILPRRFEPLVSIGRFAELERLARPGFHELAETEHWRLLARGCA